MSDYIIYKREKCLKCVDGQHQLYDQLRPDDPHIFIDCGHCIGGYIETPVNAETWLLETLERVRWDEQAVGAPQDVRSLKSFENLRLESEAE